MTNRIHPPSRDLVLRGLACLAIGGSLAFTAGCGQEEEVVVQAPAPRKAPPPPPPPAPPNPICHIMALIATSVSTKV
jgi:hypothetical protein